MIDSIRLEGFKTHADTTIELGRLTVLAGPNGSGKTSVLEALQLLCRLGHEPFDDVFRGRHAVPLLQRRGAAKLSLTMTGGRDPNWRLVFVAPEPQDWRIEGAEKDELPQVGLYRFDTRALAQPSYSEETTPTLEADGSGLATVVAALRLSDDETFGWLLESLRAVVPTVRSVRVRRAPVERAFAEYRRVDRDLHAMEVVRSVMGDELLFDFADADDVPAHAVSDGTLLVLAVLTVLSQPDHPRLVLLDDLERALHPLAQQDLVRSLRRILDATPTLQVVATTHSPFVLDEVQAGDVWVLARCPDGSSAARRLTDHPDAQRALQVLAPGEFLSSEGEAWAAQPVAS